MSITEKRIWQQVSPKLNALGVAYRIETANAPGFSDAIWFTSRGIALIELKAGPLKWRPAQKLFVRQMYQLGLIVLCFWRRKASEPVKVFRAINLIDLKSVKDLKHIGVPFDEWVKAWSLQLVSPNVAFTDSMDPDTCDNSMDPDTCDNRMDPDT